MKTAKLFLTALIALPLLAGCDNAQSSWEEMDGTFVVSVSEGGVSKYYSLATGTEVSGAAINSTAWDIGFVRTRQILTNSGYTAATLQSGGDGYAWYTEKFDDDFDTVTFENRLVWAADNTDWGTDKLRYTYGQGGVINQVVLNVMGWFGYAEGNGLSPDTRYRTFQYGKGKSFLGPYTIDGTMQYPASKRVFVLRHGDGTRHSKVEIVSYTSESATRTDTFVVKYENLDF